MRTDRQTERDRRRQTDLKLIIAFRKYANSPKNVSDPLPLQISRGLPWERTMVSTLRSRRLTARAMARDIITGEICSRCLFIVDTRRLRTVILDARCSDETAPSILRVLLIPCRWRRQVHPKHH